MNVDYNKNYTTINIRRSFKSKKNKFEAVAAAIYFINKTKIQVLLKWQTTAIEGCPSINSWWQQQQQQTPHLSSVCVCGSLAAKRITPCPESIMHERWIRVLFSSYNICTIMVASWPCVSTRIQLLFASTTTKLLTQFYLKIPRNLWIRLRFYLYIFKHA